MFLKKMYSDPVGLFASVQFTTGLNFIFGSKDAIDPKDSLNSIGKSTFLDLLDFCLLASPTRIHNPRLFAAKEILSGYSIILEFSVEGVDFIISRSIDDPNLVTFGKLDSTSQIPIDIVRKVLGNLVFQRTDYSGTFSANWFRILINFFLKIQKFKRSRFTDPIRYIPEASEVDLNYIHLYLLDLDNSLALKIAEIRSELKKIKPAINEIERFVAQKYDLKNLADTNSEIAKLKIDIKRVENALKKFELGEQYEDAEREANLFTKKIKELVFENHKDKKDIYNYKESIDIRDNISPIRISNIYKELDENIASNIKKTLYEATEFRKQLSKSRLDFLQSVIKKLEIQVQKREQEIIKLERKRADLFYFLSAKEAIGDLTEAFFVLSEKKSHLADLESSTRILNDLLKERVDHETALKRIESDVYSFIEENSEMRTEFFETLLTVYNAIYIENKDELQFSLSVNPRKYKVLDINITIPDMFGKGKNQGRTLIYDLAVLIHNMKHPAFPKFLVHDGIFDGVDKAQFIATCEFVSSLSDSNSIQYIVTVNEEGTLNEKFGVSDYINPESIRDNAILVLGPKNKLFGKNF